MKKTCALWRLVPLYTLVPLISMVAVNAVTYYATRILTTDMYHHHITLSVDGHIPFVKEFIIIYVLAYLQWGIGFVLTARESRAVCYRFISAEAVAKLLCMLVFLVFPTTMQRADVTGQLVGSDFCSMLTRLIYASDRPDNLFPSIHCLESWILFRASLKMEKTGKGYRIFSFVFALLVFASTVLVKQHVAVDILGGVAVAEIGLWLSDKIGAGRIYKRINDRLKV